MTKERELEIINAMLALTDKYDEIGEEMACLIDDALDESDFSSLEDFHQITMSHVYLLGNKNDIKVKLDEMRDDLEDDIG